MSQEFPCDFYIGDKTDTIIKPFDYEKLNGFKKKLLFKRSGRHYRLKGLARLALKRQYSQYIVTGDSSCWDIWLLLIICRLFGKKTYLWTHGWYSDTTKKGTIVSKIFYSLASGILLYGNMSRDYMISKGFNSEKLLCIYNSLDYDKQLPLRKKYAGCKSEYISHFGNDYPNLFYIGRLQKRKKINLVIEAMHILHQKTVYVNFTYVGDSTEDIGINDLIQQYGLKEYTWEYGPLYDEEKKAELMSGADICISPGNVGLTAMDCLMYGLPVITSNNFVTQMPEFEAIKDNESGCFFDEDNPYDLAQKIEYMIEKQRTIGKEMVSKACYQPIDLHYNPHYQISVLKKVLK